MLELRRPLSKLPLSRLPLLRIIEGPGLLVQRIADFLSQLDLRSIDPDYVMLSMAETDPDYAVFLNSEGLLRRNPRTSLEAEAPQS